MDLNSKLDQVNRQLSVKAPAKIETPNIKAAIYAAQHRVALAKAQCAAISEAIPSIRGSAKLVVSVRELNAKLASMERELAAVAKSVEMISKIP